VNLTHRTQVPAATRTPNRQKFFGFFKKEQNPGFFLKKEAKPLSVWVCVNEFS